MTLNLDALYRQLLAQRAMLEAVIILVRAEMPPEENPDDKQREKVFNRVRKATASDIGAADAATAGGTGGHQPQGDD